MPLKIVVAYTNVVLNRCGSLGFDPHSLSVEFLIRRLIWPDIEDLLLG